MIHIPVSSWTWYSGVWSSLSIWNWSLRMLKWPIFYQFHQSPVISIYTRMTEKLDWVVFKHSGILATLDCTSVYFWPLVYAKLDNSRLLYFKNKRVFKCEKRTSSHSRTYIYTQYFFVDSIHQAVLLYLHQEIYFTKDINCYSANQSPVNLIQ